MNYDIPGRDSPAKVVLHKDGREVSFPLPYPADGPDADLLKSYPLIRLVPDAPVDETPEEPKPHKPSRKEV